VPEQAAAVGFCPGDVVRAEMDNLLGDGFLEMPEVASVIQQVRPLLDQVRSVSTVKMQPGSGPIDMLVLLRMQDGIEPAWQAAKALAGQNAERLTSTGPGRYELDLPAAGMRIGILRGDQIEKMDDDLVLIGGAQILSRFPLETGSGVGRFRDLLNEVPAGVRYWQVAGMDVPALGGRVEMISHSRTPARQQGTIRFPTTEAAMKARAAATKYLGNQAILEEDEMRRMPTMRELASEILSDLNLDWHGRSVDYSIRIPRGFVPRLVAALDEARNLARDTLSRANLRLIATAVILYQYDHDGRRPTSLEQLLPYSGPEALFATIQSRRSGLDPRRRIVGRVDYRLVDPPIEWQGREIMLLEQPWVQVGDDRMNAADADGEVFALPREEYDKLLGAIDQR
jgi:hypothetical protein